MNDRAQAFFHILSASLIEADPSTEGEHDDQDRWFPWHKSDRQFFTMHRREMRLREAFADEFPTLSKIPGLTTIVICQRLQTAVLKNAHAIAGDINDLLAHFSHADTQVRNLSQLLAHQELALRTAREALVSIGSGV